jgi:poly(A) RNA polymerase GLD2
MSRKTRQRRDKSRTSKSDEDGTKKYRQRTNSSASSMIRYKPSNNPLRYIRDRVSREIWQFYIDNAQTPELLNKKLRLKEALHRILGKIPNYDVTAYIVGSTQNGLANNKSDVDICLVMTDMNVKQAEDLIQGLKDSDEKDKISDGFAHESVKESDANEKVNTSSGRISPINGASDPSMPMLEMVKDVLKNQDFVSNMQIIAAKVPILKFIDKLSGIEATLNVNKFVSIRNTHLIHDYTKLDWRLQPLIMLIKAWASDHGINDAYNKSISSYSLVLMVIHYLQFPVDPPVLPCLQRLKPQFYDPDSDIKSIKFVNKPPIKWKSQNQSSLKDLLLGFLDYYSYTFCYERDAISVRLGQIIPKHVVQRYKSDTSENYFTHWKYLCIEEPFNRTNTARSVYDEITFQRILSVFRVSHYTFRRYPYLDSIMSVEALTNESNKYTNEYFCK